MNRRELIKSLAPLTTVSLFVKGQEIGKAIKLDPDPGAKYIVLLSAELPLGSAEHFAQTAPLPIGTPIYIVHPHEMDDAIRIYKL